MGERGGEKNSRVRHLAALSAARLSVPCQTCGAGVGEPCEMPSRRRADSEPHESRYLAALPTVNDLVDRYHDLTTPPTTTERGADA